MLLLLTHILPPSREGLASNLPLGFTPFSSRSTDLLLHVERDLFFFFFTHIGVGLTGESGCGMCHFLPHANTLCSSSTQRWHSLEPHCKTLCRIVCSTSALLTTPDSLSEPELLFVAAANSFTLSVYESEGQWVPASAQILGWKLMCLHLRTSVEIFIGVFVEWKMEQKAQTSLQSATGCWLARTLTSIHDNDSSVSSCAWDSREVAPWNSPVRPGSPYTGFTGGVSALVTEHVERTRTSLHRQCKY